MLYQIWRLDTRVWQQEPGERAEIDLATGKKRAFWTYEISAIFSFVSKVLLQAIVKNCKSPPKYSPKISQDKNKR
jgi:hypothetical protein